MPLSLMPAIGMPGPFELGVIFVIILLFFGVGKLPEVFRSLGQGVKEFKDAQRDDPDAQLLSKDANVDDAVEVKASERETA